MGFKLSPPFDELALAYKDVRTIAEKADQTVLSLTSNKRLTDQSSRFSISSNNRTEIPSSVEALYSSLNFVSDSISRLSDDEQRAVYSSRQYDKLIDLTNNLPSEFAPEAARRFSSSSPNDKIRSEFENRPDAALAYAWRAVLPFGFIPGYIEACSLPSENIDVTPYHIANTSYNLPGFVTRENISITVYEDRLCTSLKAWNSWRSAVEKNSFYGRQADYKKTGLFTFENSKKERIMSCQIFGMWPTSRAPIRGVSDSSERITYEIDFVADRINWIPHQ